MLRLADREARADHKKVVTGLSGIVAGWLESFPGNHHTVISYPIAHTSPLILTHIHTHTHTHTLIHTLTHTHTHTHTLSHTHTDLHRDCGGIGQPIQAGRYLRQGHHGDIQRNQLL